MKGYKHQYAYFIISFIFLLSIYYIYLFQYTFSFNYHLGTNLHYPLLLYSFSAVFLLYMLSFLGKTNIELNYFDVILIAVLLFFIIRNFDGISIYNETINNTIVFIICYFVFRSLPVKILTEWFLPVIIAFFLTEVYLGCKDIYYNWNDEHLSLTITGSMNNSGIYAIYLAIHMPIVQHYLNSKLPNGAARNWMLRMVMLIVLLLVWLTQSRTGLLMIVFIAVIDFRTYKLRHKQIVIVGFIMIGIIVLWKLMYARTGSISGRYLVWKISLLNIKNSLLSGIGYGRFSFVYPQWQISYFKTLSHDQISEILHADATYIAFNEPLQFLIETGLVSFVLAVILLMRFLFKDHNSKDSLALMSRILLSQIVLASFFSYPLHVNAVCVLFCLSVSILSPLIFHKVQDLPVNRFFGYLCPVLFGIGVGQASTVYMKIHKWDNIRDNLFVSEENRVKQYGDLYHSLQFNGKFLLEYGELLYSNGKPEATQMLEESKKYFLSDETLLFMGKTHESHDALAPAIESYSSLSYLIPYKFGNRAHLVELYLQIHDTTNAVKEASFILLMPVKKDSIIIRKIKENMFTIKGSRKK